MWIDLQHFTPASALIGGALIGSATGLLVLVNGRIAGISGIFAGLLFPHPGQFAWRLAFFAGLLLAGLLLPELGLPLIPGAPATVSSHLHTARLVAAGLLVGLGTRYGSGCTSGHGVCGLARGSQRSLVATGSFMLGGFVTVALMRHLLS